eukprot:TRINITY_DN6522_c0_g1_i1.p1 TRINITY_DN6522_c0_g1~~TRINITY_DN6522_c0_g1_i1.p1  ORF type:complete len:451 (+),score=188.34 TRINITY_DN6522_c0_g1_i1:44-1396(+)
MSELLKAKLRSVVEKQEGMRVVDKEGEEEMFKREYLEMGGGSKVGKGGGSFSVIPQFYKPLPGEEDVLQQKLREEARAQFLQRRSKLLLDNAELKELWVVLDTHTSGPPLGEEQMMDWNQFCLVRNLVSPKCKEYFKHQVFAKLQQGDRLGRVSIMALFNYVMRKVWLHQTRIGLSLYDVTGQGFLRESDLENYILELIETLPQLDGLEKSFHSFYVCTAVRKFFFFLDPLRTGKIKIQDVLACSFLDDLLELRDQELPKELQEANWFSAPSALRVYGQYLNLDTDHNGMLSMEELGRYGTGTLTQVTIQRIFQECLTYDGEMDYKTYLDFVLAMENKSEPQSLQYLFRVLDTRHEGFLSVFSLNYFFRAIQEEMRKHGQDPVPFLDVKDEIFDMVAPTDPLKITLVDLISSGQGDTVVSILTDLNGFWSYENREVLVVDNGDGAENTEL